jgi:type IV pilus assembly protein PilY1
MNNTTLHTLAPIILLLALLTLPSVCCADAGDNWCVTPPYISANIQNNLLLLIDNSASMYDLAYQSTSKDCFDDSYANGTGYEGYFQKNVIYQYDMVNNKFVTATAFPSTTATYDTSYLYIHMTGSGTSRYVDSFYARGNFLNWLTMSKLDIEKGVLTGGLWIQSSSYLMAQSRGCNGRRFLKTVPFADWIHTLTTTITLANGSTQTVATLNLAIRGPQASENYDPANPNNMISPATLGGETKIEIYESPYNYSQCQKAITSFQTQITTGSGVGSTWSDVQACLGTSGTGNTAAGRENSNYTEWVRDCIQIGQNIRDGLTTFDPGNINSGIMKNVTPSNFAGNCEAVYTATVANGGCGVPGNVSNGNSVLQAANLSTIQGCASLNNPLGGNFICSRKANLLTTPVAWPYNAADTNTAADNDGYAGSCWDGVTQGGSAASHFTSDACLSRQILHFCASTVASTVIDPSNGAADTATTGNLPSILVEAGLRSGGTPLPYGSSDGNKVMLTAVAMNNAPTDGIIQNYGNKIRLGVMTFNYDGSKTECYDPVTNTGTSTSPIICGRYCQNTTTPSSSSLKACKANGDCLTGETCTLITKTDGSKILTGAYIGDPIGDHTSGIVQAIDNIKATSWTPFTEAMYNAIGYYAKGSDGNSRWRLQADDFDLNRNPQQFLCQKNYVLLITDGMSTADQNSTVHNVAVWAQAASGLNAGQTGYDATNKCPTYSGSRDFDDMVWLARHKKINDLDISSSATLLASAAPGTPENAHKSESIKTYIVNTGVNQPLMPGQCNPTTLLTDAATNGGTTLYQASQSDLKDKLKQVFTDAIGGTSSGTAASILSNSEGSGANILQAVFYPQKTFEENTIATWIGEMQNLWYYVDPAISNSTIREDTVTDGKFNLHDDYLTNFFFDTNSNQTLVQLQRDVNGNGSVLQNVTTDSRFEAGATVISPDLVNSLWRAGRLLWARNLTTHPRSIKTTINGTSLINFSTTNAGTLESYLQAESSVAHDDATNIINYINGTDSAAYRKRTVNIKYPNPSTGTITPGVWRLGDIISSTPRLQSSLRQNSFDLRPPNGYADASYASFVGSNNYKERGMVYVGANDGMLHALKLGTLDVTASGFEKATLTNPDSSTPLGFEQWAFIPRSVLPYLKYTADTHYSHIYSVDGSTTILDASIGVVTGCTGTYDTCTKNSSVVDSSNNIVAGQNNWRSILISGMGLGGASSNYGTSCADNVSTEATDGVATCVKTPLDDVGYSSYFALDVTNPLNPSLLWEFNNPNLGYATTGPAIIRVGDKSKNGKWFAVFASGPTGPIDTAHQQFLARSNQPLRFFIVDIATGTLVRTITTTITNAFAGSMIGGSIDTDRGNPLSSGNYQDDAIYVGYVQANSDPITSSTTWTNGGVVRLTTASTSNTESDDPNDASNPWKWSKVIYDIGPVTTQIARLQDKKNKNLWLYFGTGRYYYRQGGTLDDFDGPRALYGIKEPCYNTTANPGDIIDKTCTAARTETLTNQSGTPSATTGVGWVINLDGATTDYGAERVVTDTVALTNGAVFFTSFMPTTDPCGFGGNSYMWGVKYDTGGQLPEAALQQKALIQLSTGEFKQQDLSTALTDKSRRRMGTPMTGKPPTDAPPILSKSGNKPIKRILHIQER